MQIAKTMARIAEVSELTNSLGITKQGHIKNNEQVARIATIINFDVVAEKTIDGHLNQIITATHEGTFIVGAHLLDGEFQESLSQSDIIDFLNELNSL